MPTNHTEHYRLSQWERSDQVRMEDFNKDNAKIDTALRAEADTRASADATINATLANHAAQLALRGNCQIYTTSYVGNGRVGQANPITLTFPRKPLLVAVMSTKEASFYIMIQGCIYDHYLGGANYAISVTWNGNSVSWFGNNTYSHLSQEGITYQVIAFMAMD